VEINKNSFFNPGQKSANIAAADAQKRDALVAEMAICTIDYTAFVDRTGERQRL
jgi:hypothetical protein